VSDRPADNPFASRRIDRLAFRSRGFDADAMIDKLRRQGGRGAVVGPHGSGKTTLMDHLADLLAGPVVRIRLDATTKGAAHTARGHLPDDLDRRHSVLIDGAEQLGRWSWWRLGSLLRDAGIVVITGHRPGRLPTLYRCTTDPALLHELVAELAPDVVNHVDLGEVYVRHKGNIRLCFMELYDVWARRGAHHRDPRSR